MCYLIHALEVIAYLIVKRFRCSYHYRSSMLDLIFPMLCDVGKFMCASLGLLNLLKIIP